jgi:hypothetical protein
MIAHTHTHTDLLGRGRLVGRRLFGELLMPDLKVPQVVVLVEAKRRGGLMSGHDAQRLTSQVLGHVEGLSQDVHRVSIKAKLVLREGNEQHFAHTT